MTPFIKGIVLGISIAAPVGPIGLLCIRKTLAQGKSYGFAAGMGAATADAMYASIAALGLTVVSQFLIRQSQWLNLIGAVFLFYLAYRTFRTAVNGDSATNQISSGYLSTYATTLFLTFTNPMTIVSFVGIFAGMSLNLNSSYSALSLVSGVLIGSAAWWLLLSMSVGFSRRMIGLKAMRWINYASGAVLAVFGFVSLLHLIS